MTSLHKPEICITGIGAACGLGYGKQSLLDGLLEARSVFALLVRPGRQSPDGKSAFVGVEMPEPADILSPRVARTAGFGSRVAVAVLDEAWREAGLDGIAPERVGLVVGGSNLFSREQMLAQQEYANRQAFTPPRHGHVFMDSEICGICTSHFPIRGFANTVGAASASGAVAVLQAHDAVQSGRVDACIALGALQDVSYQDLAGFRALGAMGPLHGNMPPELACRPFDSNHDGFIFGESCAALVVARSSAGYGRLRGAAQVVDGQRGPEPCQTGQMRAIRQALAQAGLAPSDIDYVSAHGTGTPKGDEVELASLRDMGLHNAWINAAKSILGHGLSSAGAIELAALLLQLKAGMLHPTRNLARPLDDRMRWVRGAAQPHEMRHALKLSFGFGGTNVALVVQASGV
jgi:malonyl-ACP decarboxylase